MDEYRYPDPNTTPEPAPQPRRRRRAADTAEGTVTLPGTPYTPEAEPVQEQVAQPDLSFLQPEQPWQARPGFAPEQRTVRRAPVQDPYHYTPPAQEAPAAPPRNSPKVSKPPVMDAPQHAEPPAAPAVPAAAGTAAAHRPMPAGDSWFDGKLHQQIGYAILGFLVTVLTLGICYPWALCKMQAWRTKHTVIQGRRLVFDGKATQLFGKWLLWMLLCIVTLGIYIFWVGIALEKWRVKHTHFAEIQG